ncbi:hypothetical protein CSW23_12285 [Thermus scotoductus]|uniref:HTH arsR-type domain-containing protein n=2 Tax=Thermus TaxID=270 RepID=A0A430UX63_THESC|nr:MULTISPECIES: helix-turn-helix domain-containing protein [Thermus]RTH97496.1 hypothetical protein CSW31_11940 [Thermus scotoductus]RTI13951.1 hypothetical protein CSW23_12285 [Thermus scotoductus]BCZ88007.1 hypothetical protein TthAA11_21890 [Thermus thermophilus]BCZ95652.1 hypothetical protein TthAK1_22690 [Thermus thermophilus]
MPSFEERITSYLLRLEELERARPEGDPREGSLSAGEIAERLPLARSTLSRHLAVLQAVGLVEVEREGRKVYRLSASVLE